MSPGVALGVFVGELAILAAGVAALAVWKPLRRAWGAARTACRMARALWQMRVTKPGLPERDKAGWASSAEFCAWTVTTFDVRRRCRLQRAEKAEAAHWARMRQAEGAE